MFNRVVMAMAVLSAGGWLAGCSAGFRPLKLSEGAGPVAQPAPPAAPRPQDAAVGETGVHTLRLLYSLSGRKIAPELISFEQIDIRDEIGKPCPVTCTNWGKSGEYWAGISFTAPPEARKITASFVLSLDNANYPLTAVLTRIDPTHWRVDYGIIPPNP